ncbi:MAG: flippase [candidate division KSB1 bacterium]|nr:flippase [candidate division KSB1 bacterium]MDZ7300908.1 flippase [candidate division KSB1 bacterium]MDZ7314060.1 flippase [candidate division KSB1 bacterium]
MNTVQRLFKNTSILILANLLQPVISFYLIITISRVMKVDGFGAYNTILKYVAIFQIIAAFGLRSLLTRDVAQNKESTPGYFTASSSIAIALGIASAVLMSILVSIISNDTLVIQGTICASLSLVAAALIDAYEGIISGFERLSQIGYASILENVARVGLSLLLIYHGYGVIALIWVYVITRYLKPIYYFYYIKKHFVKSLAAIQWPFIKELTRQAQTFALITICVIIYWNADGIMLEAMRSKEEVGYYAAAYRFLLLSLVLVDSFVNSLFPVISNFFKSSGTNFELACRKSLRMLAMVTVPVAVAFSLLAKEIILLFYGKDYLPSVRVLQILGWALVPYGISQIFAYALVASNNQKLDLLINAASMLVNIALNFLLISRFGFIGATIAALISINIYVSLQIPFIFQKLIRFEYKAMISGVMRITAAALIMGIFIVMLRNQVNLLALLPLSFLLYALGVYALGVIPASDQQMLFRLMKKTA